LFERFEAKLDKHSGDRVRPAVELAKDWRTGRMLRRREAMLAAAVRAGSLARTGTRDVPAPAHGLIALGSGGAYAQAAARALLENAEFDAETIVRKSLSIAGDICIYANHPHTVETL